MMDDLYSLVDEWTSKSMLRKLEADCAELNSYFGTRWLGINNRPFERLREEYEQIQEQKRIREYYRGRLQFFSEQKGLHIV